MGVHWRKVINNPDMVDTSPRLCYKSCGNYIVTMKKLPDTICNESRNNIVDPINAKFRANKLLVVSIQHKITKMVTHEIQNTSYVDQIWYRESEVVSVNNYCKDPNIVCAPGIHYFLSLERAFCWGGKIPINGLYQDWHSNGRKSKECTYVNGKLHGLYQKWYSDGTKHEVCTHINGVLNGECHKWYNNGNKYTECGYVDGKLH